MDNPYVILGLAIQLVFLGSILRVMGGILAAVKTGLSEVIKGLESIDRKLDNLPAPD
jgi:hypothetical protein